MRLGFVVWMIGLAMSAASVSAEEMTLPSFEGIGRGVTLLWEGAKDRKAVALTFDDGPARGKTDAILDFLAKEQVPATFFVLGEPAQRAPDLLDRMVREGHEIGNHTFSHPNLTKIANTKVREEIKRTQDIVFEAAGVRPIFFRPPYGAANLTTMSVLSSLNLTAVFWSIDPQDWKGVSETQIVGAVTEGLGNGAIILLHEKSANAAKSLPGIVQAVRSRGLEFETLSAMFGHPPQSPQPKLVAQAEPAEARPVEPDDQQPSDAAVVRRLEPLIPPPVELAKADSALPGQPDEPVLDTAVAIVPIPPTPAEPKPTNPPPATPTSTPTATASFTQIAAATPTHTETQAPTSTHTETPVPTPTATATSTSTPTAQPTDTPSPTPTSTSSPIPTPTPTPTFTPEPTPIPTFERDVQPTEVPRPVPVATLELPRGHGDFLPVEFRRLRPVRGYSHKFLVEGQ